MERAGYPQPPSSSRGTPGSVMTPGRTQQRNLRAIRENLFLHEMERLADAMCRHYVHPVDPENPSQLPPDIPVADVQRHAAALQATITKALRDESKALATAATSARTQSQEAGGTSRSARMERQAKQAAQPQMLDSGYSPVYPSHTADDVLVEGWTHGQSAGVSGRLRDATSGNAMLPYLQLKTSQGVNVPPGSTPIAIRKVKTETADELALVDVVMDGNSRAIGCRRRKEDKVQDALRKPLAMPEPPAQLTTRTPREVVEQRNSMKKRQAQQTRVLSGSITATSGGIQRQTTSPRHPTDIVAATTHVPVPPRKAPGDAPNRLTGAIHGGRAVPAIRSGREVAPPVDKVKMPTSARSSGGQWSPRDASARQAADQEVRSQHVASSMMTRLLRPSSTSTRKVRTTGGPPMNVNASPSDVDAR